MALQDSRITSASRRTRATPWPTTANSAGDQAGQNEEPFSYHSGGVNALFGDGSVRFIKSSINLAAFRSILTLAGGEVVSSDQF